MKVKTITMWCSFGRDKEQNPRYAAMRGTDENRYRGEARGS